MKYWQDEEFVHFSLYSVRLRNIAHFEYMWYIEHMWPWWYMNVH